MFWLSQRRRTRRVLSNCWATDRQWGMDFRYAVQPKPDGLAQAFLIGPEFRWQRLLRLVLGDNIFYGHQLAADAASPRRRERSGATVFAYRVRTPSAMAWSNWMRIGKAMSVWKKSPPSPIALCGHRAVLLR